MGKADHTCAGPKCKACYDAKRWAARQAKTWTYRHQRKTKKHLAWLGRLFKALRKEVGFRQSIANKAHDMNWRKKRDRAVARDVERYGQRKAEYHAALVTKK